MTGWGSFRAKGYSVNIRGLNSKFKEVVLHIPQEFFAAEPFIYKFLNEKVSSTMTVEAKLLLFII